jgi:hypothetical protein
MDNQQISNIKQSTQRSCDFCGATPAPQNALDWHFKRTGLQRMEFKTAHQESVAKIRLQCSYDRLGAMDFLNQ